MHFENVTDTEKQAKIGLVLHAILYSHVLYLWPQFHYSVMA